MSEQERILKKVIMLLEYKALNSNVLNLTQGNTIFSSDGNRTATNDDWVDAWELFTEELANNSGRFWPMFAIISVYTVVVVVSLFGNIFVCKFVYENNKIKRTITNVFIFNMATSDLLMTVLNIPFSLARILLNNWPFGKVMCALVPSVQVTSVYVSTFTMTCVALDRHQAIMNPLQPRLFRKNGLFVVIFIWIASILLSLPNAIFNSVVEQFTYRKMFRCITQYPSADHRKGITLYTVITQYLIPLILTSVAYIRIVKRLWYSSVLGAVTEDQAKHRNKAKKKTITMLIIVMVVFAFCWFPLNLYHLISDLSSSKTPWTYSSYYFFACHMLAMSSVCYNPFIYCSLNERFNRGARQAVRRLVYPCCKSRMKRSSGSERRSAMHRPSLNVTRSDAITNL